MKSIYKFVSVGAVLLIALPVFANQPNPNLTPGYLCSPQDPNFAGYAYPEHVAVCNRNVSDAEKARVGQAYGLPTNQWSLVEFDHLIPLCAGGSDDIRNIWPQPLAQAHEKDKLENQVCIGMKNGTMTQQQAVQAMYNWIHQNPLEME